MAASELIRKAFLGVVVVEQVLNHERDLKLAADLAFGQDLQELLENRGNSSTLSIQLLFEGLLTLNLHSGGSATSTPIHRSAHPIQCQPLLCAYIRAPLLESSSAPSFLVRS